MPDREKVLRGLECCIEVDAMCWENPACPYCSCMHEGEGCMTLMMRDALALLKAQEARVMTDAELMDAIRKAPIVQKPAVDAAPLKRGEWKERRVDVLEESTIDAWQGARCSVCGLYHTTPYLYYFKDYKFCPNCGARMRGGADER